MIKTIAIAITLLVLAIPLAVSTSADGSPNHMFWEFDPTAPPYQSKWSPVPAHPEEGKDDSIPTETTVPPQPEPEPIPDPAPVRESKRGPELPGIINNDDALVRQIQACALEAEGYSQERILDATGGVSCPDDL